MLINVLNPLKGKYQNLYLNAFFLFSKLTYYRQMAKRLDINLPKLNDEIQLQNHDNCIVYGIKQIPREDFVSKDKQQQQNNTKKLQDSNTKKQRKNQYFDEQTQLAFLIDNNSTQNLQFDLAKRIAQNLELDVCLMKQTTKKITNNRESQNSLENVQNQDKTVLSLTRYREFIYRQYYLKELKNKSKKKYIQSELTNQLLIDKTQISPNTPGSYKNRTKSIRIGQEVHSHDMKNKQNQITRWLQQGQRSFKVIANSNSDKSYKAIQKFCGFFQKQVQIVEEKIQPNPKKKAVFRLYAILQFQEEIQIDPDFINRRWRRRQAEINLIQTSKKSKNTIFDVNFASEDPTLQKAYLAAFDECGIPYPKQYSFLTDLDKSMEKQGLLGFIRSATDELQIKKSQATKDYLEEEELTQKQLHQRDKENRNIMGVRTVEDILQEMEQMKSRQYQMEQYQSVKFKQLQIQLTGLLQNAKLKSQN